VSIDGTRIAGNASPEVNHEFDRIAREVVAEARAADEAEDELYGQARGDELPEQLRTPEARREVFGQARRQLRGEDEHGEPSEEPRAEAAASGKVPLEFDAERIVARTQGREGWLREGRRELEPHRWRHPDPIVRSRRERLLLAGRAAGGRAGHRGPRQPGLRAQPGDRARPARSAVKSREVV
jgi:hypothetical protein